MNGNENEQAQRDTMEELHAQVQGRVQGVGFRYFVIQRAVQLGLRGYVRNKSDGSVEVVAQGPRPALERLVTQLWQGPSGAYVRDVQTVWREPVEYLSGFHIRW
jgi:acylphosphatase